MNNYQKKLIKSRPQHFQQGGYSTNIAIGSPKPYTTQLQGVSFNPLTLNNSPIQVDTKGLTEQINRLNDIAFKKQELDFKNKELDFKKDKEYMDLYKDLYAGMSSTAKTANSLGGFAMLGFLGEQGAEIERKRNEFKDKSLRAAMTGDIKTLVTSANEAGLYETSKEVLEHKAKVQFINDASSSIIKGDLGVYGADVFSNMLDYVINGEDQQAGRTFNNVANGYLQGRSNSVTAKDIGGFMEKNVDLFDPIKEVRTEILDSGARQQVTSYKKKDLNETTNAFISRLKIDPLGRGQLHILQEQAFAENIPLEDYIKKLIDPIMSSKLRPEEKIIKDEIKAGQFYNEETGLVEKVDDSSSSDRAGSDGKLTDRDKDVLARKESMSALYGPRVANDARLEEVYRIPDYDKYLKRLNEILPDLGVNVEEEDAPVFGAKEAKDIPLISQAISNGIARIVEKDGKSYLVTNSKNIQDYMDDTVRLKNPDVLKVKDSWSDSTINDYLELSGENEWDTTQNPFEYTFDDQEVNSVIYELKDAEENKPSVNTQYMQGYPADYLRSTFGINVDSGVWGNLNTNLAERAADLLVKNNMRITAISNGRHKNDCHKYGECFDMNFSDKFTEENVKKIPQLVEEFASKDMKLDFEVSSQKQKNQAIEWLKPVFISQGMTESEAKNKAGDYIKVITHATSPHFSVYDLKPVDNYQATQTDSEISTTKGGTKGEMPPAGARAKIDATRKGAGILDIYKQKTAGQ